MSELDSLSITGGGWLFPKQEEVEEKVNPMQSSRVEFLRLSNCILSEESLAICLKWFSNVKEKSSMKDIRFTNPENYDVNKEHAL
jgi:hypothetical protein